MSRKRKPYDFGQQALLYAIVDYFGGIRVVSKLSGLKAIEVAFYRRRGWVPLCKTSAISKALGITPFAFCYPFWSSIEGQLPSWEEVVSSVKFLPKPEADRIKTMPLIKKKKSE